MSREVVIVYRDDLDRSADAVKPHSFSLDDQTWEIDLSEQNWQRLTSALAEFLAVARPVKRRRRRKATRAKTGKPSPVKQWSTEIAAYAARLGYDWTDREVRQAVRRWARDNDYQVGLSGLLPRRIIDAHHAAHHISKGA